MSKLGLTNDFPQSTQEDWKRLVEKGLKGAGAETLLRRGEDGFARALLSTQDDRPQDIAPLARAGSPLLDGRPWHITAPMRGPDIAFANQQGLEDLQGGASALRVSLAENGIAENGIAENGIGQNGIEVKSHNDIKRLFDRVLTDLIPIVIAPNNAADNAALLKDYKAAHIYLGLSPDTNELGALCQSLPQNWRAVTINAAHIHDKGATYAQELAYFAAGAAKAFRVLGKDAPRHINAELTTDQDGHMSIAKLRAARRIYARIAQSFGAEDAPLSLHVISSKRMMQSTDPWSNMLRVMSAGFGAVIGGGDFITLRPFTDANGPATPFGYRAARNMQLMMMEESHLGQASDAGFGSYFHEQMSGTLALAAWTEFQQIESEGGFDNLAAFMGRVEQAVQKRAQTETPILGVTLHPLETGSPAYREPSIRKVRS